MEHTVVICVRIEVRASAFVFHKGNNSHLLSGVVGFFCILKIALKYLNNNNDKYSIYLTIKVDMYIMCVPKIAKHQRSGH